MGDAPAGDLYLRIRLVPHPLYDVEGHNLIITLPLAPWEAALGTRVVVPTLDGDIRLTIPENTPSGKRLRIRGKGLPSAAGKGDLFAVVKIAMPDQQDDSTRELWRQMQAGSSFNPRAEWGTIR